MGKGFDLLELVLFVHSFTVWRTVVDTGDLKIREFKVLVVEVIDKKHLEYNEINASRWVNWGRGDQKRTPRGPVKTPGFHCRGHRFDP